ncbi:MAG: hypothetical protein F4X34_02920 [Chloroflexi bacterium]|nr:hypothetical protein [Chloroflexota bacterium]
MRKSIWTGDNLDILRGMNSGSVDLIYLDPPFNSNRNYSALVGGAAEGDGGVRAVSRQWSGYRDW